MMASKETTQIELPPLNLEVIEVTLIGDTPLISHAWLNWPARVAALMAAELGVEAHAMQKVLEAHVRAQLSELADVRPEFR